MTPLSIHSVTPDGSVSGPLMKASPGPVLLVTSFTANLLALYVGLASSSPDTPAMLTLGAEAAFWAAVAVASAVAIVAPTSASTLAPQASSAAWMRVWSGLTLAGTAATCAPGTDGSASGGSAPSGRETSVSLASSVAQTWSAVGSVGSGGRLESVTVVPT